MPSAWRSTRPGPRRAARRSMSRSSPARITAARRPAPTRWSRAGIARVVVGRCDDPEPAGRRARVSRCCARPASPSTAACLRGRGAARPSRAHHCASRAGRPARDAQARARPPTAMRASPGGPRLMITGRERRRPRPPDARPRATPSWSASARSLADDPLLTVPPAGPGAPLAVRIVARFSALRLPPAPRLVATARASADLGRRRRGRRRRGRASAAAARRRGPARRRRRRTAARPRRGAAPPRRARAHAGPRARAGRPCASAASRPISSTR